MKSKGVQLLFFLMLIAVTSLVYSYEYNYAYVSGYEKTRFGDRIKFWGEDTLCGTVRSNDTLSIMQCPVFYDLVITSADTYWCGIGCDPHFEHGIIFNAPRLEFPERVDWLRDQALGQGHFFPGNGQKARVEIRDNELRIWWAGRGVPFDYDVFTDYSLPDSAVVFFECPLQVFGTVYGTLILGSSGTVGLEDNILYASADPLTGIAPEGHPEKFALISEGDIKILNTVANGRENSSGLGLNNPNRDLTSIVLDGFYFALNESFTFEQQNDADSGYVYDGGFDDRGYIYLWGGLAQRRRGYVHRSNNGSTGYAKRYRFDQTLFDWDIGVFNHHANVIEPPELDFGEVPVGETVWDTIRVTNERMEISSMATATWPFYSPPQPYREQHEHIIPVRFTPPGEGTRTGIFTLRMGREAVYQIPLSGRGVNPEEPAFRTFTANPNPFNSQTMLTLQIRQSGHVRVEIFDILGRRAAEPVNQHLEAGTHRVSFDGGELAAGLYLARLTTPTHSSTHKLLLVK